MIKKLVFINYYHLYLRIIHKKTNENIKIKFKTSVLSNYFTIGDTKSIYLQPSRELTHLF